MEPLDPAFFDGEQVRGALRARDIGTLYRLLRRVGISQRRIGQLTNQSQSEVSEILRGRRVHNVEVLERIADGLGVPRARLGVSYGEQEEPPSPWWGDENLDEDVKRRILLAAATTTVIDQGLYGRGDPQELALPTDEALPSRLGMADVHAIRAVTEQLHRVAQYYGGQADLVGGVATRYARWLQVPASEEVRAALAVVLAQLHTQAGWCCHDEGVDGTGFFTRALITARRAGDCYGVANAAWLAGGTLLRSGHPNDALKLFQLGQLRLAGFRPGGPQALRREEDPRLPIMAARLHRSSATAYALMGDPRAASRCLAQANDGWAPREVVERANADFSTAGTQLDLGHLDTAEQFATRAVRGFQEGPNHRGRTLAALLLAEVQVRAGEPGGLSLAHQAIEAVRTRRSVRARRERLLPLATALEARPGSDTQDLARKARQVATTQG